MALHISPIPFFAFCLRSRCMAYPVKKQEIAISPSRGDLSRLRVLSPGILTLGFTIKDSLPSPPDLPHHQSSRGRGAAVDSPLPPETARAIRRGPRRGRGGHLPAPLSVGQSWMDRHDLTGPASRPWHLFLSFRASKRNACLLDPLKHL